MEDIKPKVVVTVVVVMIIIDFPHISFQSYGKFTTSYRVMTTSSNPDAYPSLQFSPVETSRGNFGRF